MLLLAALIVRGDLLSIMSDAILEGRIWCADKGMAEDEDDPPVMFIRRFCCCVVVVIVKVRFFVCL